MTFNNLENKNSTEKKTIVDIYKKIDCLQQTIQDFGAKLEQTEWQKFES